jgi:hypothetical protein
MYASFLRISRALHPDVFEQPEENHFFNNLLEDVFKLLHRGKSINIVFPLLHGPSLQY